MSSRNKSRSPVRGRKAVCQRYYQEHNVKIVGEACPSPYIDYNDIKSNRLFSKYYFMMEKLKEQQPHHPHPTCVQAQVIPTILARRKFCLVGKRSEDRVAAYLLPAIMYIDLNREKAPKGNGPILVVLAANTNACVVIQKLAFQFGDLVKVKSELMSSSQKKEDADIVVSTPERFSQFVLDGSINLDRINCLVLDELDEMLAVGLYPILDRIMLKIIKTLNAEMAQISVFCSTLPLDVRIFNEKYLTNKNYIQIFVGPAYLAPTALSNVTQTVHVIQQKEKYDLLCRILRGIYKDGSKGDAGDDKKAVLFVEPTETEVGPLSKSLLERKFCSKLFVIDGSVEQKERVRRLSDFKKAKTAILLTVNRMLLGSTMKLTDINCVVNYDFPKKVDPEACYIHQAGIAGLSKAPGVAHTFMTSNDSYKAQEIIDILNQTKQEVPNELYDLASEYLNRTRIPALRLTLFDILFEPEESQQNLQRLRDISPVQSRTRNRTKSPVQSRTRNRTKSPVHRRSRSPVRRRSRSPIRKRSSSRDKKVTRRRTRTKSPSPPPRQVVSPEAEKLRNEFKAFYANRRIIAGDTFQAFFPPFMVDLLGKNGHKKITALQSQVFQATLTGRDVLAISKPNDTERILAYLLPAIIHIIKQLTRYRSTDFDGPIVIIIVPTVDLVQKVHEQAKIFCEPFEIIEIAIGTPQSLAEMLEANRGTNYIDRCDYLVFDELHRMLDEGHVDELNVIHRRSLAPDRKHHTRLAFSPQFSIYERMFSKDFLHTQHTIVNMMPMTVAENSFRNVTQYVEIIVCEEDKRHEMAKFLEKIWRNKTFAKALKVVIFVDQPPPQSFFTKTQDRLPSSAPKILNFTTIQSDESQRATVKQFNSKRSNQILVTRNADVNLLDMTDVKLVINYEYPIAGKVSEYHYLYRISRTDRKSTDRYAVSFLTLTDARRARHLANILEQSNQTINPLLHDLTTFEDTRITSEAKELIRKIFDSKPTPTVGNAGALISALDAKYPKALPAPKMVEVKTVVPPKPAIVKKQITLPDPVATVSTLVSAVQRAKQAKIAIVKNVTKRPHTSPPPAATKTTASVSISSSTHTYHEIPPKLIINNQFINTNMSTFTAPATNHYFNPENPHASSSFAARSEPRKHKFCAPIPVMMDDDDDDDEPAMPAPPSPPKIDSTMLQMLKRASMNLKQQQNKTKEEEERKKYQREAASRTSLTDSVSAFLEKLTNTYNSKPN